MVLGQRGGGKDAFGCLPLTDEKNYLQVVDGGFHVPDAAGRIARADVARFMLDCIDQDQYKEKQLAIGI